MEKDGRELFTWGGTGYDDEVLRAWISPPVFPELLRFISLPCVVFALA